jgi:hypothetical protein
MTPGNWALLIGLLANAAAVLFGMWRINKKQDENHDLVNGRMTELIATVDAAGIAKGLKQGRDENVKGGLR